MFIFWGTKHTERKQGLVADFCPVCRQLRPFRLQRLGLASHIYFLSFGQGKLIGHVIECVDCGLRLQTDPLQYASYQPETKNALPDTDDLIEATFPRVREVYARRLALEAQIQRPAWSLSPEQREQLLLEPFSLLNPGVETRYASSSTLDKQSGLGCMGTLLVTLALLLISVGLHEPAQSQLAGFAVLLGGAGTLYTLVQIGLGPGRFLHTQLIPKLACALDPLEPTQEELQRCLEKCKAAGMKIGQKVKLPRLWTELTRRAASHVAP